MDLKYYNSGLPIRTTPFNAYREDFNAMYDLAFENASNAFNDIEVENNFGEKDFVFTSARVDSVINPSTGEKWGDDYKYFVFHPNDTKTYISRLLKWKDNYWIVINANTFESMTNGCVARRCNNFLRWIDDFGNLKEEPCIIDYSIMQSNNYVGKDLTVTAGVEKIWCQKNSNTNLISENQRFLFGVKERPKVYKIYANGIRNFLNTETNNNYSPSILELTIGADYFNLDTDDATRLIADINNNNYSIIIQQDNIEQLIGFETRLSTIIKNNNTILDLPVKWETSDENICKVNETGILSLLSEGSATVTVYLEDNINVKDNININVVSNLLDEYYVKVNPINYNHNDYILQGDTVEYECLLYKNEIKQENIFQFELQTKANKLNYNFNIINGNKFIIKNNKQSNEKLNIVCKTDNNIYTFNLALKGAW